MSEHLIIRGDMDGLPFVAAHIPKVLQSYRTNPGTSGGNWYGRGPGRNSVVIYTVNRWYVEVYRTKTAIVLFIAERVKE